MKKKNYVSKAVMLGALLAPIWMPTVSVLADSFYQNQTSPLQRLQKAINSGRKLRL